MRNLLLTAVLVSSLSASAAPLVAPAAIANPADFSQLAGRFQVDQDAAIPGAVLKSGSYILRVVDRLSDRSILRVENLDGKVLSTFLAIPNRSLAGYGGQGPVAWTGGSDHDRALRGFNFPGAYSVEFVYPKAEAVKIAVKHSAAVEAIDPPSDNLPSKQKNLTQDDMRIVTLWTLSPTRVNGTAAIAAQKYKPTEPARAPQPVVARNEQPPAGLPEPRSSTGFRTSAASNTSTAVRSSTPSPAPVEHAAKTPTRRPIATALPHTASELPLILLGGLVSVIGIGALRSRRLLTQDE